jgi:hypothetical protein
MPQKEAVRFALISVAGVPTKPSRSRQFRGNFASDGGTSNALQSARLRKISRRQSRAPPEPLPPSRCALGDPARHPRALWSRGVAGASAQRPRLTPQGRMIDSKKRKRCMNSISSALPPPPPSAVALVQSTQWSSRRIRAWERVRTARQGNRRGFGADSHPRGWFRHAATA